VKRRNFINAMTAAVSAVGMNAVSITLPDNTGTDASCVHLVNESNDLKLTPPSKGKIPVAIVISSGVTMIDYAGPWEVFQDVYVPNRGEDRADKRPFSLYTVSDSTNPIVGSAGLKLIPEYTFQDAPTPKVVVIPAQGGQSQAMLKWIVKASETADVVMSVCTGAFILAQAGLLAGKSATTHHESLDSLAKEFPNVDVKRGLRFVEGPKISSAGGLTSGIDLALRVVERYFGREVANSTATYMEYESKGWMVSPTNQSPGGQ